jgi:tetratricopeptide (TPR) repeat protein
LYLWLFRRIYIECNDKLGQSKVYNNVGLIYGGSSQGEFTKALDFFEHALNIEKEAETLDHSRVAATLNNIAGVYYNQGNYSEALNYFEQVLNIQHEMLGYNDPNLALVCKF